jgi:hypothetical protein
LTQEGRIPDKEYAKIHKPVSEVFDAVVEPAKLKQYFITGGASAPLAEGATVTWEFADFPGAFAVHVRKVVPNRSMAAEPSKLLVAAGVRVQQGQAQEQHGKGGHLGHGAGRETRYGTAQAGGQAGLEAPEPHMIGRGA